QHPEVREFRHPIDLDEQHIREFLRLKQYDRLVMEAGEGRVDQRQRDVGIVLLEGGLEFRHELLAYFRRFPLRPSDFGGGSGGRGARQGRYAEHAQRTLANQLCQERNNVSSSLVSSYF